MDLKERFSEITQKLKLSDRMNSLREKFARFATSGPGQAVLSRAEWLKGKLGKKSPAFYGKVATVVLSTYFLSDVTALLVGSFYPDFSDQKSKTSSVRRVSKRLSDFDQIQKRNLFNSQGLIPEDEIKSDIPTSDGPAVKTSLPFQLVGTIILEDSSRSVGTIVDKSASRVYPVKVTDEIPKKAKIISVTARRVEFINLRSKRKEFVEMPRDKLFKAPIISKAAPKPTRGGRKKPKKADGKQNFEVSRSQVDGWFQNLNKILTEARAVPHFESGEPAGYKIFQIVPGSMYDQLGIKNGDILKGVNGEEINEPSKAFEYLSELQNSNEVEISVERNGKVETFHYSIN